MDLSLHDAWLAPIPHVPYVLIFNDGTQYEGQLDAQGQAQLHDVPHVPAQVYYGQDPRPLQARVEMPANTFQANSSTNEEAIANIQRYLADSEVFWTQQASTEQKEVFDDLNHDSSEEESLWDFLSEEQQRALRQKLEQDDHA